MRKKMLYAALVGAMTAVVFCTGHYLGTEYQASRQVCSIPEAKTVAFLEEELGKCFVSEDRAGRKVEACINEWKACREHADAYLCKERNLWFERAHQVAGVPFQQQDLLNCPDL